MPQGFELDRPVLLAYFVLLAGGCRAGPEPVIPVDMEPVNDTQVAEWVTSTIPSGHHLYRFKWLYQDERGSAGGRGSARLAPPDSVRLDVAGPFGAGAASAVVVDEQALWMEPADEINRFVPNYPLMWAMFGIARRPPQDVQLRGLSRASLVAWQYAGASDTLSYVRTAESEGRLIAEVHRSGQLFGRVETTLSPAGPPLKARLTVPSEPAQLDLTFLSTNRDSFAPEIWRPRRP
jgi:hypothetical protein